jgi:hypothetical protein
MSAGARRFFSGESEAQAVLEAAASFGLLPGELAYRQVEKKHGFLRRPKVVIEVDPEKPRRLPPATGTAGALVAGGSATATASQPPAAPRREREPPGLAPERRRPAATERDDSGSTAGAAAPTPDAPTGGLADAVAAAEAVAALAGLRLEVRGAMAAGPDGEELRIELSGGNRAGLVARHGELLRHCEYLARRMVRDLPPGGLHLDSGGFRAEREGTLRRRAAAAAEEVRRSGEPVRFEPLPAAERRVLHLAIQAEPAVRSESEGDGDLRSVCVLPVGGGGDGAPV